MPIARPNDNRLLEVFYADAGRRAASSCISGPNNRASGRYWNGAIVRGLLQQDSGIGAKMRQETVQLGPQTTGCRFELQIYRYGGDGGQHAYIQAGLHADEIPGLLVATRLLERFEELERAGALQGRITLVPLANPIGLSQRVLGEPQGRFDLASGENFNRGFPDVVSKVRRELITHDPDLRPNMVAEAFDRALKRHAAPDIVEELQQLLLRLSSDADTVIDLHSDHDAEPYLYVPSLCSDDGLVLARLLGAEVIILTSPNETNATFEDASLLSRIKIGETFQGDVPPRFVSTVELRGQRDVAEHLAHHDAEAIIQFLGHRGVIAADAVEHAHCPSPSPILVKETEVVPVIAKQPGILLFETHMGAIVEKSDPVATLIDPGTGIRQVLQAPIRGRVFSRTGTRYAVRGVEVVRLAAMEQLTGDG